MKNRKYTIERSIHQISFLLLWLVASANIGSGQTASSDLRELKFGRSVDRKIAAGELHEYKLALRQGQVLFFDLQEESFDTKIGLIKADDQKVLTETNLGGGLDRESLIFVAEDGGDYLLRVSPNENEFGGGAYRISAHLADQLTEQDREKIKAQKLLSEAIISQKENTAEKIRESINKREQALVIWQNLHDDYWTGRTLDRLGVAHNLLQENNKAIECANRALEIVEHSGDKPLEGATLNTIGSMTNGVGEYRQAIDYHNRALRIFQNEKNNVGRNSIGLMSTLMFLGNSNLGLKDYAKANEYFQDGMVIAQREKDKNAEATYLYFLGAVLEAQNDKPKALERYDQSLSLWREIKNKTGIPLALSRMGPIQNSQGKTEEAVKNLKEALSLFQAAKNRGQEAATYSSLGLVYHPLGKTEEAIGYLKVTLAFYQEFKIRNGEIILAGLIAGLYNSLGNSREAIKYAEMALATEEKVAERTSEDLKKQIHEGMRESKTIDLKTLGGVYFNTGENEKALQYYHQALERVEKRDDENSKREVWMILSAVAQIHIYKYEWDKALENENRCLSISRELGDQLSVASSLNTIGLIYNNIGEENKALKYYQDSLEALRLVVDKTDITRKYEASILGNIGSRYLTLGEPKKALDYQNQSLKAWQEIKDPTFIDGQSGAYESIARIYSFWGDNEKALELLNKSLDLFRQAPQRVREFARNRSKEGSILNTIGTVYKNRGNSAKAMEYYNKSLTLAVDTKRMDLEASVRNNISLVNLAYGEPQTALQNLSRALEISHKIEDKSSEPTFLNNIAEVYSYWGDQQQTLKYQNEALRIAEEIGNKDLIATNLNNIGNAYMALSENEKAFDYLSRSLKIAREIENKNDEATALSNLAFLYSNTGERGKALDSFEQALSVARRSGARSLEATVLGNMGYDHLELGEYEKALEKRNLALKINRDIGDKAGEISQLLGIGMIYRRMGEKDKNAESFNRALGYYESALKSSRETENKVSEAAALLGIGQLYVEINETSKALPILNEALDYSKKYQNRFFEDIGHFALGRLYEAKGEYEKSVDEYQQSFTIAHTISDKDREAKALYGLMSVWNTRGNLPLAIFYGKQAVNTYQELRGSIRNLKKETQEVFRGKITDVYRSLADILIESKRLPEAEEVLAMLKEQETFEFVRRDGAEANLLDKRVILGSDERKAIADYARLSDDVIGKSQRRRELEQKADADRTKDEQAEIAMLATQITDANEGIKLFFARMASEFTKKVEDDVVIDAKTVSRMRTKLRELRQQTGKETILISTYLLPQRYRAIITTADAMVDRKTEYRTLGRGGKPVDGKTIDQKIVDFKQALKNPYADPKPLGKELYDIFIKPLEHDIIASKAKTILWSLDGNLRYIPIAALYDGKQYLAERYDNAVVTLGRTEDLFNQPAQGRLRILGLGVSKQHGKLDELKGVPLELSSIVRDERNSHSTGGIVPGISLLDEEFTGNSFAANLKTDSNSKSFNIVHLATHFLLEGNIDDSGILLGDGQLLSLHTLDKEDRFDFSNVDLLTLSACETAVSIGESNGGEVESLGILAQRKGAKSVMATLWKVADASTTLLMSEFYRLRQDNPTWTKAKALDEVQVLMISGRLKPSPQDCVKSHPANPTAGAPVSAMKCPDFTHPYYWSPFVLIGNWR